MSMETNIGAASSKKARKAAKKRFNGGTIKIPQVAPTPWDAGATGQANRRGLVTEDVGDVDPETGKVINPNRVQRARRVDMLEVWHRRGLLSTAAFGAAEKLRDAYEGTQRAPGTDYAKPRVDSTPKPDHAVTIQIYRMSQYHRLARHVSARDIPLVSRMVLDGAGPEPLGYRGPSGVRDALRRINAALERIADTI